MVSDYSESSYRLANIAGLKGRRGILKLAITCPSRMEYNAYDRAGRWAMLRLYLYINSFLFLCYIGMLGFAFFIHIFMIIFLYDTNNNKVLIIIVAKFNIIDAIFLYFIKAV